MFVDPPKWIRAEAGDNYWKIAARLGHDTEPNKTWMAQAIQQANGLVAMYPGQYIAIPPEVLEPEPEPEPVHTMLVGATPGLRNGEGWAASRATFERAVGKKLQITRRFLTATDIDKTWGTVSQLNTDQGYAQHISIKGSHSAAKWDRFLASIPRDGQVRYITNHHEPEGDMTPIAFQAMQATMLSAIERSGNPDLNPCVTFTGWWDRDTDPATTTRDLFPPDPEKWVLGLDPYDTKQQMTLRQIAEPTLKVWRDYGGKRWGIGEFNTKRTGAAGATWITDGMAWARAEGCEFMCIYHDNYGANAPWWVDDPAMLAAFAAQIQ